MIAGESPACASWALCKCHSPERAGQTERGLGGVVAPNRSDGQGALVSPLWGFRSFLDGVYPGRRSVLACVSHDARSPRNRCPREKQARRPEPSLALGWLGAGPLALRQADSSTPIVPLFGWRRRPCLALLGLLMILGGRLPMKTHSPGLRFSSCSITTKSVSSGEAGTPV